MCSKIIEALVLVKCRMQRSVDNGVWVKARLCHPTPGMCTCDGVYWVIIDAGDYDVMYQC